MKGSPMIAALGSKPRTTKLAAGHKIYPYLLRDLVIDPPNQVWAADITYRHSASTPSTRRCALRPAGNLQARSSPASPSPAAWLAPGSAVRGDGNLLTQMLANLVENAIRQTTADTTFAYLWRRRRDRS